MQPKRERSSRRALEPYDRISEVLFGLIMVLTFTGSLSVADAGRDDVRAMLIGALGCNLAWGLIDALLYLMGCLSDQGRGIRALKALRNAKSPEEAHGVIADALPPLVASTFTEAESEALRRKLLRLPAPPDRSRLRAEDLRGALAVFLLVVVSTLPVAVPFMFMHSVPHAMRVSNAIAIVLLFVTGYAFGRTAEHRPVWTGLAMVVLGAALVGMTIALGG